MLGFRFIFYLLYLDLVLPQGCFKKVQVRIIKSLIFLATGNNIILFKKQMAVISSKTLSIYATYILFGIQW